MFTCDGYSVKIKWKAVHITWLIKPRNWLASGLAGCRSSNENGFLCRNHCDLWTAHSHTPKEYCLIIYISACKKVPYFSLGHVPILKGIVVVEGREDGDCRIVIGGDWNSLASWSPTCLGITVNDSSINTTWKKG